MKNPVSPAKRHHGKVVLSYILLTATVVVLALSLVLIRSWTARMEAASAEPANLALTSPETESPAAANTSPENQTTNNSAEPAAAASTKTNEKAIVKSRHVAIVIDDVGNSLDELDPFLSLPLPITFAVMPQRTYSRESVRRISAAGKNYIMHQPMEPVGDADPGKGAIYSDMSRDEVFQLLDKNLASLGSGAEGLNNHMGSRVTADAVTMTYLIDYLKSRDMYFLDSYTTPESVAEEIAVQFSLPYIKRNSMFLDNENERQYVERALRSGFEIAESSGRAVMIGHVWDENLADLLLELYPEFTDSGFTFDTIGSMIYLGRQAEE